MNTERDEIWGIAFARVCEFFSEQRNVIRENEQCFMYKNTRIELERQPDRKMGSLVFPRTRVVIRGEEAEEIYRRFYLRFLSAGG